MTRAEQEELLSMRPSLRGSSGGANGSISLGGAATSLFAPRRGLVLAMEIDPSPLLG